MCLGRAPDDSSWIMLRQISGDMRGRARYLERAAVCSLIFGRGAHGRCVHLAIVGGWRTGSSRSLDGFPPSGRHNIGCLLFFCNAVSLIMASMLS